MKKKHQKIQMHTLVNKGLSMVLTKEQLAAPIQGAANFTLLELISSVTATKKGISNVPDAVAQANLILLAQKALQPCRDALGRMVVNSGYRGPELNTAVGGSPTSWHCKGCAADIEVPGKSLWDVFCWFYDNVPCVELIAENLPNGWIHVAYSKEYTGKAVTKYKLVGQPVKKASFEEIRQVLKQQGVIC